MKAHANQGPLSHKATKGEAEGRLKIVGIPLLLEEYEDKR